MNGVDFLAEGYIENGLDLGINFVLEFFFSTSIECYLIVGYLLMSLNHIFLIKNFNHSLWHNCQLATLGFTLVSI